MAHVMKMTRGACGHMFKHYERAKDQDGEYVKFGNQQIDTNKTHLNYNLGPSRSISQWEFVKQRTSEVHCLNRKDVNVACTWVVTKPKDLTCSEEKFFEETYKILEKKYGSENVISAHVHRDEVTPHMHFSFIPVVHDKKKDRKKVSAKEVLTRKELQKFHPELDEALKRRQIYSSIQNEATREGNKSISELKRGTATIEAKRLKIQNEKLRDALLPLQGEYEAKKAYVRECDKASNVSMAMPKYAEISTRGILKGKREYVTVPKEKWEAKHVSVNEKHALERATSALESRIDEFSHSLSASQFDNLKNEVGQLTNKVYKLQKENRELKNKLNGVADIITSDPELKKSYIDAKDKFLNDQIDRSESFGRSR